MHDLVNIIKKKIENECNSYSKSSVFEKEYKIYSSLHNEIKEKSDFESIVSSIMQVFEELMNKELENSFVNTHYEEKIVTIVFEILNIFKDYGQNFWDDYLEYFKKYRYFCYYYLSNYFNPENIRFVENPIIDKNNKYYKYIKTLLSGALDYFNKGISTFSKNEAAIKYLCFWYSCIGEDIDELREEYAATMYDNVRWAGNIGNLGYAYNGLTLIKNYFHFISVNLTELIFSEYKFVEVVQQPIYRQQICTMINSLEIDNSEKKRLKFLYIDGIIIIDELSKSINNIDSVAYYSTPIKKELSIFEEKDTTWIKKSNKWICNKNDKNLYSMYSENEMIYVSNQKGNKKSFKINMNDFLLQDYKTKIREHLSNLNKISSDFFFSYVYIYNTQNDRDNRLDFNHLYDISFNKENNTMTISKSNFSYIKNFYSEKINSVSCIVGKNGTGKTMSIDFLKNSFFEIVESINSDNNDTNIKRNSEEQNIFCVIFELDGISYYVSNVKVDNAKIPNIKKYEKNILRIDNNCHLAYFSNQIRPNEIYYYNNEKYKSDVQNQKWVADFSEESMINTKIMGLRNGPSYDKKIQNETITNIDLLYQIYLFKQYEESAFLKKYLPFVDIKKVNVIGSDNNQEQLANLLNKNISDITFLYDSYAKLGMFSAGQYAKISFLAKLNWYFNVMPLREDNKLFESFSFPPSYYLCENDTVVVLIDEGELYYHPEWQREFFDMLIQFFDNISLKINVQIVFTTNSPFVLSDILKEDIQYIEKNNCLEEKTFGQSIYSLIRNDFYLKNTIGNYSMRVISSLSHYLKNKESKEEKLIERILKNIDTKQSKRDKLSLLIDQIGEPVYRKKLKNLLSFWRETDDKNR